MTILILLGILLVLFSLFILFLGFCIVRSNASHSYLTAKQIMADERERLRQEASTDEAQNNESDAARRNQILCILALLGFSHCA